MIKSHATNKMPMQFVYTYW